MKTEVPGIHALPPQSRLINSILVLLALFQKLATYCSVFFPSVFLHPDFVCSGSRPNFKLWGLIRVIHGNPVPQSLSGWELWIDMWPSYGFSWKHERTLMRKLRGDCDFLSTKGHVWLFLTLPLLLCLPSWPALPLLLHFQSCHHVSLSMMGMPGIAQTWNSINEWLHQRQQTSGSRILAMWRKEPPTV